MPRRTALEALERFRRDSAWSRQVMNALTKKNGLDDRDGALASRLFYGTLQNLLLCDYYIDSYARGKLEPKVRDILRLGVYQILFMDKIPVSAAVNEAVSQCKPVYQRAAGLVNAVLRRIAAERDRLPALPPEGTAEYLSVRYSHPLWLVNELIDLRGYDGAAAVLRANNTQPPVYIQPNTMKTTPEALCTLLDAELGPDGCLLLPRQGDFGQSRPFADGLFYIQDPAAHAVTAAAELRPGMRVLDACAAPGGKSFSAAIAMRNDGLVLARDINGKKLALVSAGARRLGLSCIRCEEGDARDISGGDYDVVLADVPCSGLGVIRKKPDIRYRQPEELTNLPQLQGELLAQIATAVRPGGCLIYSTCTWRPEENQGVTNTFLCDQKEFVRRFERTYWPDTDGTDGFYICRMDRISRT